MRELENGVTRGEAVVSCSQTAFFLFILGRFPTQYKKKKVAWLREISEPEVPSFGIDTACRGLIKGCLTL